MNYLEAKPTRYQCKTHYFLVNHEFFLKYPPFPIDLSSILKLSKKVAEELHKGRHPALDAGSTFLIKAGDATPGRGMTIIMINLLIVRPLWSSSVLFALIYYRTQVIGIPAAP